ncbi:hypothetical protein SuNHUV7_03120 (plasmid) [Pseudoseohaeicola sp. NH-UV-7]|jgi:hypothetical protein
MATGIRLINGTASKGIANGSTDGRLSFRASLSPEQQMGAYSSPVLGYPALVTGGQCG